MSGYKGNNFRKFKEHSGSSHGGGASQSRGGQPDRGRSETTTPFLNDISAMNMERYLEAVHQYSLTHHALVAPWFRGRIPIVMLEHELPRHQQTLIGRLAKHHSLDDGLTSTVNLLVGQVRNLMIQKSIEEIKSARKLAKDTKTNSGGSSMDARSGLSGSQISPSVSLAKDSRMKVGGSSKDADLNSRGSEANLDAMSIVYEEELSREELEVQALSSIFPHNAKKSRETERSNLWKEAATLLGKMLYFWPSKDIQVKMLANTSIVEAFENTDVIRFIDELRIFSLAGSGNPEANREAAEAHLVSLQMKPGKALEYFKEFTEAVEHIRVCKSSFSDFKVVDMFFRHLDQKSFPDWYVKFLTEDDPLFRFQSLRFDDAKEHALKYHNNVIRVSERTSKAGNDKDSSNDDKNLTAIKSVNHLKSTLAEVGKKRGSIAVDPVVLATLLQRASAATKKRRVEEKLGDKSEAKEEGKVTKKIKAENDTEKKVCFKFRDEGTCVYGSNCYFAHSK
jgi:hypothetical protein